MHHLKTLAAGAAIVFVGNMAGGTIGGFLGKVSPSLSAAGPYVAGAGALWAVKKVGLV